MKIVGLFGHPVSHSLSPMMHNLAFEKMALPYRYFAFDINPDQVKQAVDSIRVLGIRGVNVTIPYKETVIPFLDAVDRSATMIGAVNTIVNDGGKLTGYNTDGQGYVMSLEEELNVNVQDLDIVILGAGGAARGIIFSLLEKNARNIALYNRNKERAEKLVAEFDKEQASKIMVIHDLEQLHKYHLIINTTPSGMYPNVNETPIDIAYVSPSHLVSDIVYNPLMTKFLKQAQTKGATIHHGLGMFIYQGAIAFELWTGQKPPVQEMYKAVQTHLIKQ
ncbi:shikimate dehydrogenase [Desulfuribacillus stibiiarsenatis]|uniref:Shikimate dehydrogenase (NADP(+)) n=1 Tax=Desulfuribacillus stibiiarsenatis TaxID=1390249 RepID=A0A1E5L3D3_9FIRM|nr:shikimate dehydrogenase [Desulfuribacillus stibiiarsenatis]OEH84650.1 shikimate dehydrogenase [Desulfuribacillus stibiiarsenatis]